MKHIGQFQVARTLLAAALPLLLVACATPARVEQMQVNTPMETRVAASKSALKESVAVRDVTGGKDTNPMWISSVSSADFERALEASLKDSGLWSANRQASKYVLVAQMLKLDQPFMGASMTVTATVRYLLVERSTNRDVLERTVSLPYTAAWNDAFMGSERMKLANEGAMRVNIQALIDALVAFVPAEGKVQLAK